MSILEALGVVGQFGQCLMPPIKRQFSYVFRYNTSIGDLKIKVEELERKESDVQQSVDAAKNNLEKIKHEVEKWLEEVKEIKTEANGFLEEYSRAQTQCIHGLCPNIKTRYVLGKKAKRITGHVLQLQVQGEFGRVSLHPGPVSVDFASTSRTGEEFESRISIEEKVMVALKDDNADIIGIYGMGGVGKTTMAKRIFERVKEASIFPKVVMAVVSQQPDVKKIQSEIAVQLGLQLTEESSFARQSQLARRLMNEEKILIILDDLWEMLNLQQELGIPTGSNHRGCKILLTSRDKQVCNQMNASEKNTFMVSPLSEEEALSLLKEKSCYYDDLSLSAMQIAKECKGLPIALVTVGRALKGKSLPDWKNALIELKRALPQNIPRMIEDVYRTLKLSYTNLESGEARSLFLICCLYPEDFKIPIEDLIRNGMGLQMFRGTENLEEARDKVHALVGILKDRCLLIEADEGRAVMMHDVIRDVAIYIASEEEHTHMISPNVKEWTRRSGDEKYVCVSAISEEIVKLPTGLNYPNLELLQLRWNRKSQQPPDNFFEGMRKLKVIDVWSMQIFSLPSSLQFITNLHTLQLRSMPKFGNVSVIGKLVNLEILSFRHSGIEELPEEVGVLTNLRLLDLHRCRYLRKIAPGVIQKLVRLEELYMMNSFSNWEAERDGEQRKNASLAELKDLTNLTTVQIQIPHPELIPENMWSSMNLKRYSLSIYYEAKGEKRMTYGIEFQKEIQLSLPTISHLEEGIKMMLKSIEALHLRGNGAMTVMIELVPEGFQHLKKLNIQECDPMEYLGKTESLQHLKGSIISPTVGVFPVLEELYLHSLGGLKEIWHDQLPEGSFRLLRDVYMQDCNNLEKFFSLSTGEALPLLEKLEILHCEMLKEVFSAECRQSVSESNKICFTKLRILTLKNLPSLTIFCNGIHIIEFPQLTELSIDKIDSTCLLNQTVSFPRLKTLDLHNVSYVEEIGGSENQNESFRELEVMVVESCNNLRSLSPLSIARNIINFERLEIINCKMMIEIISIEEEEEAQGEETIMEFPSMTKLIIKYCPNMKEFSTKSAPCFFSKVSFARLKTLELKALNSMDKIWCRRIQDSSFKELEVLVVESCGNLRSLFPCSVAKCLVNLKQLEITNCMLMTEIIEKEEEGDVQGEENLNVSFFPQLESLKLEDLAELRTFCHMKTFSLTEVCTPKLNCISNDKGSPIKTTYVNDIIHHPFNGHVARINENVGTSNTSLFSKVSFARLKSLVLMGLNSVEKIWCSEIEDGSLRELEDLEVISCNNLRSLFHPSMAKSLINLKELKIRYCKMMTEVITEDKEEETQGEEKLHASLFPQLERLYLASLDELKMFCHIKHAIELPSLYYLRIEDCSKMETFSLGSISTPKLKCIHTGYRSSIETTNVNDTIQ